MAETLGHYKILERVGVDGLGQVYRARDTKVGRTVLIKSVGSAIAERPNLRPAFLADAHRAAAVSHPNVATLFDVADEPDGLFLAIEYANGEPLRRALATGALHPRRAIEIATQIADGLAEAHALGVLHLDICPDNIVLTSRGTTKLLDLGLSAWTNGGRARVEVARALTTGGSIRADCGPYLSPEQARGGALDERSDLFSLGSVLFEMLTGQKAFAGATPVEQARAVLEDTPPPPSQVNREVPVEVDALVARALEKDRDQRIASAAAFAAELRALAAVLDVRAEAAEPPTVVSAPRTPRWPAIAGIVAVVVVLIAWWLMHSI